MQKVKKSLIAAEKKVAKYIKENPKKSAAIATAVAAAIAAGVTYAVKKKKK